MTVNVFIVLTIFSVVSYNGVEGQSSGDFTCPHDYGFYPHSVSCDKYYKCENSVATLETCGNGLAFDDSDPKYLTENCDYLHNVKCGSRSKLEPPISTSHCPRLYGIFPDEERCDTFWSCWAGESSKYTCAPGLAYDIDARVCMWADQVKDCHIDEPIQGFKCPNPKDSPNPATFSRHAHPEDCRKYFVCLDGNPREYGCPIGTVFKIGADEFSGQCTEPEDVPGCEKYYGDDLKGIKKSHLLLGYTDYDNQNSKSSPVKSARRRVKDQTKTTTSTTPATIQSTPSSSRTRLTSITRGRPVIQSSPIRPAQQQPVQLQSPQKSSSSNQNDDYYYYYYEDEDNKKN